MAIGLHSALLPGIGNLLYGVGLGASGDVDVHPRTSAMPFTTFYGGQLVK